MAKTAKKTGTFVPWNPISQFSKDNQPSPELKKAGRERRKEAQRIMDMVMKFGAMTVGQLKALVQKKWDELTVTEARIVKYVSNDKYLIDWLDRHVPKAPQSFDLGWSLAVQSVWFTIIDETLPNGQKVDEHTSETDQETGGTADGV